MMSVLRLRWIKAPLEEVVEKDMVKGGGDGQWYGWP